VPGEVCGRDVSPGVCGAGVSPGWLRLPHGEEPVQVNLHLVLPRPLPVPVRHCLANRQPIALFNHDYTVCDLASIYYLVVHLFSKGISLRTFLDSTVFGVMAHAWSWVYKTHKNQEV